MVVVDHDGCDVDMTEDPTPDDQVDLLVLFADALDPDTPGTVKEREAEWKKLFT